MATANLLQTSVSGGTQNALSLQGDGVFFPKASTTSRLALTLTTTDKGFIVYDTTDNNIYFWNGAAWESVPSSGDAGANGSVQYNDNGIVSGASNFVYDKVTGLVTGIRYISTSSNAALPSFAVAAGNGIYNSGANQIGFAINSANAMTLNSTGLNVVGSIAINGASLTYPFNVRASSSNVGNTAFIFEQLNGTPILTGRDNGTVIIAGDIRVGNTVSVVSPTAPNRTIAMIVNGVTLYIAAKTTND